MKRKTAGIAVAVALGVLSTSVFAITPFGNVNNKGSLLVYQRVDVYDGNDTLMTLTNDSSRFVKLKCYYASSDQLSTPSSDSLTTIKKYKHYTDFTIDLTPNQPISWWASSGRAVSGSRYSSDIVAPPFGYFASDGSYRDRGEMKCWAVNAGQTAELHFNHLFGTASILNWRSGQAAEYNATAFQALGPSTLTGTDLGSPGVLNLDNAEYDACPNMLLGNFQPGGKYVLAEDGTDISPWNRVTLASCNQDLRQNYTPTITKLTWTFWNQDEQQRTGTHTCADSWFETYFPASMVNAQAFMLGTDAAYFRIESTPDQSICENASTTGYTGIIERKWGYGFYRATELVGRGAQTNGAIKWDPQR